MASSATSQLLKILQQQGYLNPVSTDPSQPGQIYQRYPSATPQSLPYFSPFFDPSYDPRQHVSAYKNYDPIEATRSILTRLGLNELDQPSTASSLGATAQELTRMGVRDTYAPLGGSLQQTRRMTRASLSPLGQAAGRAGLLYDEQRQNPLISALLESYGLGGRIYGAQAGASQAEQNLATRKQAGKFDIASSIPFVGPLFAGLF